MDRADQDRRSGRGDEDEGMTLHFWEDGGQCSSVPGKEARWGCQLLFLARISDSPDYADVVFFCWDKCFLGIFRNEVTLLGMSFKRIAKDFIRDLMELYNFRGHNYGCESCP